MHWVFNDVVVDDDLMERLNYVDKNNGEEIDKPSKKRGEKDRNKLKDIKRN